MGNNDPVKLSRNAVSILGIVAAILVGVGVAAAASDNGIRAGGLPVIVWLAIISFGINLTVGIYSVIRQTEHYYDLTGSFTYVTLTLCALVLGGADGASSWLMAVLILIWALRLGTFLFRRVRKAGGDTRFVWVKKDPPRFLMFWTIQALWVFFTGCAAFTAMASQNESGFGVYAVAGLIVWLAGFALELRADAEKSAFKADPANKGRFISTGIWAWSRHPNYFGEIVLWVGIAIIALPSLSGWQFVALISPVFVFVLLTKVSGVPALEAQGRKRWGDDPAYKAYVESTPSLVLRPPRS